jgi:formylmethanofuran dehydrogenase subunit E
MVRFIRLMSVNREDFLNWRKGTIEEAKKNPDVIVADPEDDIICDSCNAEITDKRVLLTENWAWCRNCVDNLSP